MSENRRVLVPKLVSRAIVVLVSAFVVAACSAGDAPPDELTGNVQQAVNCPGPCPECRVCDTTTGTCKAGPNSGSCSSGGLCWGGVCCHTCHNFVGSCITNMTNSECGHGGAACVSCNDGNDCTTDSCTLSTGVCQNANNALFCAGGKCSGGSCCTGCFDTSNVCHVDVPSACGSGGNACTSCGTNTTCRTFTCTNGTCGHTDNDGTSCTNAGVSGVCHAGACCAGCWDPGSSTCLPGDKTGVCGKGGSACTNCDGGNPCKAYACTAGTCSASNADGASCSGGKCGGGVCCSGCLDGTFSCHAGDVPAVCGQGGNQCQSCVDTNPCTDDLCQTNGACSHPAHQGACPNGTCIGTTCCAGCIQGGACQTGNALAACGTGGGACNNCDDGDPCTKDACGTSGCVHTPITDTATACSDGDQCTTGDHCQSGVCTGTAINCDDSQPCTKDTCDKSSGTCQHANLANTTACNDGNDCTTNDACNNGKCQGVGKSCDDGNPCTTDTCSANTCSNANNTNACQGGDKCKVNTTCSNGTCQGGTALDCDDGDPCTTDSCDSSTGCVHAPANSGACDDGDPCTGDGTCSNGTCQAGTPISCDDHNPCTKDTCDPTSGACSSTNDDTLPCTNGTCQAGSCIPDQDGGAGAGGAAGGGGTAGASGSGGSAGAGTGGSAGTGATGGSGGSGATGGAAGASGSAGTGGTGTGATGGSGFDAGPDGGNTFSRDPGGCACRTTRRPADNSGLWMLAGLAGLWLTRRRRNGRAA